VRVGTAAQTQLAATSAVNIAKQDGKSPGPPCRGSFPSPALENDAGAAIFSNRAADVAAMKVRRLFLTRRVRVDQTGLRSDVVDARSLDAAHLIIGSSKIRARAANGNPAAGA